MLFLRKFHFLVKLKTGESMNLTKVYGDISLPTYNMQYTYSYTYQLRISCFTIFCLYKKRRNSCLDIKLSYFKDNYLTNLHIYLDKATAATTR